MKNLFSVLMLTLFFSSCYYDNVSELHPEVGLTPDCDPDTSTVTYTKDIHPLLLINCGSDNSGCHKSATVENSGISLATYTDVSGIIPSQLLSSITHDDPGNVKPMPKDGGKLSDCKINKVRAWINQGYVE